MLFGSVEMQFEFVVGCFEASVAGGAVNDKNQEL